MVIQARSKEIIVSATANSAARVWMAGGLVGLPTETVYGLAADAGNPAAVARIFQVKGRPLNHPVIVHVTGSAALDEWAAEVPQGARRLAEQFWPGPLTLVLQRSERAKDYLTGGQDTIALRAPAHPVAHACLTAFAALTGDVAAGVAAPSANRFGKVSPTSARDVRADIGELLGPGDLVIDGGRCEVGLESTIVDCTGPHPRLLRSGAITLEEIQGVWGGADATGNPGERGADPPGRDELSQVRVPGGLAAHYAPRARVRVCEAEQWYARSPATMANAAGGTAALLASSEVATPPGWARVGAPADITQFAHDLYAAFREADWLGAETLWVVLPAEEHPLMAPIRDRVLRAAVGSQRPPAAPIPQRPAADDRIDR
ncbi:MAG: L-threonylcarbamoyladenylate synthase [Candidatus Nanopelagicales bacterium]